MRKQWSVVGSQWSVGAVSNAELCAVTDSDGPPLLPATDDRPQNTSARGFTLIELVVTLTVLTILTMGVIPLIKVSVKRQREQRLRDNLRMMRTAIDQFHREALAGPQGQQQQQQQTQQQQQQQQQQQIVDPRVRVMITDGTIFGVDNPDRYPPDLETLVNGVSVTPIGANLPIGGPQGPNATDNTLTSTKKKVYLREIPIDPMTGERDWEIRSSYDSKDAGSWGGENVFDVRSKSTATALNGEKYSDW
jgi:general secretion pathway protein G